MIARYEITQLVSVEGCILISVQLSIGTYDPTSRISHLDIEKLIFCIGINWPNYDC